MPPPWLSLLLCLLALAVLPAGCAWLGLGGDQPAAVPAAEGQPGAEQKPESVLPGGVLGNIASKAPPKSPAQYLAFLADQFGWEQDVAQNTLLAQAVQEQAWDERVEPFMLGLFFGRGFSVLPAVGDGHEFSRDAVVNGPLNQARLLVTTRRPVRIVLLRPAINVEIIYPQDGEQPQLFTLDPDSSVVVRQSRLEQYLR
ncbi:MAG: hypothetical protein HY342_11285 [Candidatus Lambdaproteobacteria bacterium]|nr:hypothetical protein [Candidatus Lambdaproteobacteria bacterium]